MPKNFSFVSRSPQRSSTQLVLREAKRLHRAATTGSMIDALPVLRRLLAARVMQKTTLPHFFRNRHTIQRKHVLRMLAAEAGHESWEAYRVVLPTLDAERLAQAFLLGRGASTLKHWFPCEEDARQFVAEQGGQVVRVVHQAVVLPVSQIEHVETDSGDE